MTKYIVWPLFISFAWTKVAVINDRNSLLITLVLKHLGSIEHLERVSNSDQLYCVQFWNKQKKNEQCATLFNITILKYFFSV